MSSLGAEDLIYYSDKENNIFSGGFKVNSIIIKQGISPLVTLNQFGGEIKNNVSDLFENLAVPNWALSFPMKKSNFLKEKSPEEKEEEDYYVEEDLHNKLLALIAPMEKKSMKPTKKNQKSLFKPKNKTKKHFELKKIN